MKNIISLFTLLFFLSLIISSCSRQPGISITKRHYRNGYHVEVNQGKNKSIASLGKIHNSPATAELSSVPAEVIEGPASEPAEELAAIPVKEKEISAGDATAEKATDTKPQVKRKGFMDQGAFPIKRLLKKEAVKNVLSNNSNTTSVNGQQDGGGLLWTLIAILIVLWLIGLLTGVTLGGLIYILLVVALILLLFRLIARI